MMSISLLLEMAVSSNPDRTAVVSGDTRLTTQQLSDLADGAAGVIAGSTPTTSSTSAPAARCCRC